MLVIGGKKRLIQILSITGIFFGIFLIVSAQDIKSPLYQFRDLIIDLQPISETDRFILKNIDKAIDRGLNFLDPKKFLAHHNMDQTEWTIFKVLVTNFLDNKPKLKKEIEETYYKKIFTPNRNYPEKFRWEFVFWDKSYSLNEFPYAQSVLNYPFLQSPLTTSKAVTPRAELFMRTMFCKEKPLTKEMLDYTVFQLPKLDNYRYELTHALMVLQFAKENDCFDQNEIKKGIDILALKIKQEAPKILELINADKINRYNYYDIFVEMVAFLLLSDHPDYVDKLWIKEIIERQNQDGGWPIYGRAKELSESHGTVVSLLALLPYKQYYLNKKPNNFGWLKELPIKEHLNLNQKINAKVLQELRQNPEVRVIVKYKNNHDLTNLSRKIKKPIKNLKVKLLATNLSKTEINSLSNDPAIESITLDQQVKADIIQALDVVNYNEFKQKYSLTGKNVKLCLVDSGINQNKFPYSVGYDFVNEDLIPEDESRHGTLVAEIIKTIAPDVELIIAKVLDKNNQGYSSNLLRAIDFCKNNNAQIINLSLGGGQFDGFCDSDPVVKELNKLALENNVFSVASAGNDGLDNNLVMPACGSQVFSVGSVDKNDKISYFSNKAAILDMFAPGQNLNIGGEVFSGTSFSAPFVSASAALLLEKEFSLSIYELKNRFRSTGNNITYYFHNNKIHSDSLVFAPFNNQNINIPRLNILNFIENEKISQPYNYSWYWQASEESPEAIIGATVGSAAVSVETVGTGGVNTPPSFTAGPSDGGSSGASPTNAGSNVSFTATATDNEGDSWKLLVCKNNSAPTPSTSAPECNGGSLNRWCVDGTWRVSNNQSSCTYTTSANDLESNVWYAFACDNYSSPSCSSAAQGFGDNGSPFKVNHAPNFSAINDSPDPVSPGGTVTITTTALDNDTDTSPDTVKLFVCKAADATSSGCGAGGTWCLANLTSSNPTCNFSAPATVGQSTYYGYIFDNHNFASSSNPRSGTFVHNSAPSITAGPSDGGSSGASPTNAGSNVSFTATATDANGNNYYLAICKNNSITANDNAAPTCNGGHWCISSSTATGVQASCNYTTLAGDVESNDWFAFVCDHATGSLCSLASQGSGNNGSPFKVNHRPSFTAINDSPDPVSPGGTVTITTTASDNDNDTSPDTVKLFVCPTNSLTSCSAGCASTALCTASLTASNPSCNYSVTYTSDNPGSKSYWGFICDNHNFSATSSQAGSFTINPALSFSISSNSVALGTLSNTTVKTGSISVTVSTNAASGYVVTLYTDGNFRTFSGANFAYVNDNNSINPSDGKYGIGTSKAGQDVKQYTSDCISGTQAEGPLSGSTTISNATSASNAVSVASASNKVSNDTTTICFTASPSTTTPAGNYSQTVTFIATGKF